MYRSNIARLVRSTNLCVCLALGTIQVACSDAPPEASPEPTPSVRPPAASANAATKGIHGTWLYRKTLGTDHILEMYELGPGATAVRESLSADGEQRPLLDSVGSFRTLGELFRKLEPEAEEAPQAVLLADARAAGLARSLGPTDGDRQPSAESGISPPIAADVSCSADYYGDGWGADWFENNYCNAGSFRYCNAKNVSSAWINGNFSWMSWRQFEGDFNLPGHIDGWHQIPCTGQCRSPYQIIVDFDYDVLPRHIEIWTYSPSVKRQIEGSSQCNHLDVAALYNN
jgi:hypothetical protein